ncbi:MAG: hypothetical protein ACJ73S_26825 [Mycobacteriales bacterium]
MTSYRKRLLRAAAVALAVAGLGLASLQAPASAAGSPAAPAASARAWLTKSQYLTGTPNSGMPQSCVSKSITLADETYEFAVFVAGYVAGAAIYTIPGGTWQWQACITPLNGKYDLEATLVSAQGSFSVSGVWPHPTSGVATWGSYLDPNVV